jgi:hypothetical protein
LFRGVILVMVDGTDTGKYDSGTSGNVEGFVVASGDITVRGSVSPSIVGDDLTTRPGFYGVKLWSWRELYE